MLFLMAMFYGFQKLNFERIHGGVANDHLASKRICEKVGLIEEGTRRGHLLRGDKRYDINIVGALRDEWLSKFSEKSMELFDDNLF